MPNTFELISAVTVGAGGAATISFSSIPGTFTDLCLKMSLRTNYSGTVDDVNVTINGSTASITSLYLQGTGSSTASGSISGNRVGIINGATSTANTFANSDLYIPNYAGSTNKSMSFDTVTENNATQAFQELDAILRSNTAAITSLSFSTSLGSLFLQYSSIYLYGVKNA